MDDGKNVRACTEGPTVDCLLTITIGRPTDDISSSGGLQEVTYAKVMVTGIKQTYDKLRRLQLATDKVVFGLGLMKCHQEHGRISNRQGPVLVAANQ